MIDCRNLSVDGNAVTSFQHSSNQFECPIIILMI